MLAFKPKAMLISVVTVFAICLVYYLFGKIDSDTTNAPFIGPTLGFIKTLLVAVIFGLGASLVGVFMKADLLDDEFLSLKEAIAQYKDRMKAAIMVPAFLVSVAYGFSLLVWIGTLLCSISVVGPIVNGILYPLAWLLGLFTVLMSIGVTLGFFLFPGIVAVRKHGWFDNVIDTFEAVGTRPQVVVASGVITFVLMLVAGGIVGGATNKLEDTAEARGLFSGDVALTHDQAAHLSTGWLPQMLVAKIDTFGYPLGLHAESLLGSFPAKATN